VVNLSTVEFTIAKGSATRGVVEFVNSPVPVGTREWSARDPRISEDGRSLVVGHATRVWSADYTIVIKNATEGNAENVWN